MGAPGGRDLAEVVQHFLQVVRDIHLSQYHRQAVWILNFVMLGAGGYNADIDVEGKQEEEVLRKVHQRNTEALAQHISSILEEYLAPHLFHGKTALAAQGNDGEARKTQLLLTAGIEKQKENEQRLGASNENALLQSLVMEGVGNFAQLLGEQFEDHLMAVLHPLLEKLGMFLQACISATHKEQVIVKRTR